MNRYLVFCGSVYYAAGGMNDFCSSFDNLNDAVKDAENRVYNSCEKAWSHVYDSKEMKIVFELNSPQN